MYSLVPEKILRLVYEPFNLAIYGWKLRIYANDTQADDRAFGKR